MFPVCQPWSFFSFLFYSKTNSCSVCKAYVVLQFLLTREMSYISIYLLHVGNAAIVLRSRLKVRVLKENREKKARVDEKGIILTNGDIESSRKATQYQVLSAPSTSTFLSLGSEKNICAFVSITVHTLLAEM